MITLILFIVAAICFVLAAAEAPIPRVNLTALGLFFIAVAFAVGAPR